MWTLQSQLSADRGSIRWIFWEMFDATKLRCTISLLFVGTTGHMTFLHDKVLAYCLIWLHICICLFSSGLPCGPLATSVMCPYIFFSYFWTCQPWKDTWGLTWMPNKYFPTIGEPFGRSTNLFQDITEGYSQSPPPSQGTIPLAWCTISLQKRYTLQVEILGLI